MMMSHIASRDAIGESNTFVSQLESTLVDASPAAAVEPPPPPPLVTTTDGVELDSDDIGADDAMSRLRQTMAAVRTDARCADARCMKNDSSSIDASVDDADDAPYSTARSELINADPIHDVLCA